MNILPKKRWHVRNKDNIARVRRDEKKAADEEQARLDRKALAEKEARTEYLREKISSHSTDGSLPEDSAPNSVIKSSHDATTQHVNLFEEVEQGLKKFGTNKEYEKEKKEEQEKQERAIGLLRYLGEGSAETLSAEEKPWYLTDGVGRQKDETSDERDLKGKSRLDPMSSIKKFVDITKTYEEERIKVEKAKSNKNKIKKMKKKRKKEKKEKERERSDGACLTSSKVSIEMLRRERLEREGMERQREMIVLAKHRGEIDDEGRPTGSKSRRRVGEESNDRKRKYHSQFNPDFVRKPKQRRNDILQVLARKGKIESSTTE